MHNEFRTPYFLMDETRLVKKIWKSFSRFPMKQDVKSCWRRKHFPLLLLSYYEKISRRNYRQQPS